MRDRIELAACLSSFYQKIGHALWQVQALEATTAAYVVVRLRDSRGVGLDRGAELSQDVERLTLGTLVRELVAASVVDDDLGKQLLTMLEERNWLAHRLWREQRNVLASDKALRSLISRLELLADRVLALNKEIGRRVEEHVVASGVDRDWIDREASRLAHNWGLHEM